MSTTFSSKLASKRILVIGGTSGMGYSVASACLESGAIVTIASSNPSKVSSAISSLGRLHPAAASSQRISGTTCDLSTPATIESQLTTLFDFASSQGSVKLDHVVNTAGVISDMIALADTHFEDLPLDRYVTALMLGKLAPRYLVPGPASSVTYTTGTSMAKPHPGFTTLAPNAGAAELLCRALAVELKPLRFNCVSPGPTATDLLHGTTGGDAEKANQKWSDTTLLGVGKVEDIAEAYLFTMRCAFVTGTVVNVDGGAILR